MNKRKAFVLALALCAVLGYIARLLYYFKFPVQSRDSYVYCELINKWNETKEIPVYLEKTLPPFGMYVLRIPSYFFGYNVLKGAILVNIVLGLFIISFLMIIAFKITKAVLPSIVIGIIACFHSTLIHYSTQVLRENVYLFFVCLAFIMLIDCIKKPQKKYVIWGGFFLTAAMLCRYEAIELLFIWVSVLAICTFRHKPKQCICQIFQLGLSCIISFFIITCLIKVPLEYYYGTYHSEISKIGITVSNEKTL